MRRNLGTQSLRTVLHSLRIGGASTPAAGGVCVGESDVNRRKAEVRLVQNLGLGLELELGCIGAIRTERSRGSREEAQCGDADGRVGEHRCNFVSL